MHGTGFGSDWNDTTIAALRSLWAEGLPTAEIGRRLGFSKNAVVGKSHRLNLPARPSPISRDGSRQAPRPPRPRCPSLSELQQASRPEPQPSMLPPRAEPTRSRPATWLRSRPPMTAATRPARPGQHSCCWPIGEPEQPSFRFCNDASVAGKPYCEAHCAVAYRRSRHRDDAA